MTPNIKPLVAGNWKMNGFRHSLNELAEMDKAYDIAMRQHLDLMVCVPATLLYTASAACLGSRIAIGGQDCHFNQVGAHTGDISAEMIADCGGTSVIVGHSERRTDHGETNEIVRTKAEAAIRTGLLAIICIGETQAERETGKTLSVLDDQLNGSIPEACKASEVVIAYEPIWAIGTGLVPEARDVEEAHASIRKHLTDRFAQEGALMRILYGGSVKPSNATELMGITNVDGALVGGASLKSADLMGICAAYEELQG
ncbi:MAG: triose-phosphate isomerase [Pseudomonadota bacterium]